MKRVVSTLSYVTLALNGLLFMLALFAGHLTPTSWLQVGGRLHPLLLHLPIGFYVLFVILIIGGREVKAFRKTSKLIVQLTAFLIVLSALAGVLLSREGGYDESILQRHLVLGTMMSIVTMLLSQFSDGYSKHRYYKIYAGVGLIVLILTGHFGAVLTHGENYFFEPISGKNEIPKDSTIFSMAVQPVLNAKCGSCHNPSKKKGDLILTLPEGILTGGEHGAVLKAGKPDESEIIMRATLALNDDDHMPPAGKAQLTDSELTLLGLWITDGAKFDARYNPLNISDSIQRISNIIVATYAERNTERKYPFAFINSEGIKELNTPFRTVSQISTTEPALKADFFLAQYYQAESLNELNSVAENIVDLNLASMPIGDEVTNNLLNLFNLERLNLNNTKVTNKIIESLIKLEKLTVIKLAGTAITLEGMQALAKSKSIREVYGWNTAVTNNDWITLRKQFNSIAWNNGYQADGYETLKLTPPLLKNESFLINAGEAIQLKHNLPGTQIRYTLDDTSPDSTASPKYDDPITITTHKILKAIAVKEGWRKSNEVSASFFVRGLKPISSQLLSEPSKDYKAKGSKSLIDNTLGDTDNFRDGHWLGYRANPMEVLFEFKPDSVPSEITIVHLLSIESFIMPPEVIEVWTGETPDQMTLKKRLNGSQPKGYDTNGFGSLTVYLNKPQRFIKLIGKPVVKLPAWHSGKGEKGWLMVSEVIFR